jgi:hypothetical protein
MKSKILLVCSLLCLGLVTSASANAACGGSCKQGQGSHVCDGSGHGKGKEGKTCSGDKAACPKR